VKTNALFSKFIDQIFNVVQRFKGSRPPWKFIDAPRLRTTGLGNHRLFLTRMMLSIVVSSGSFRFQYGIATHTTARILPIAINIKVDVSILEDAMVKIQETNYKIRTCRNTQTCKNKHLKWKNRSQCSGMFMLFASDHQNFTHQNIRFLCKRIQTVLSGKYFCCRHYHVLVDFFLWFCWRQLGDRPKHEICFLLGGWGKRSCPRRATASSPMERWALC